MSAITHAADQGTATRAYPGHWDWWLIGATVLLAGFGLLMILSASSVRADAEYGNALRFVSRQGAGLLLGLGVSLVVLGAPWLWLRQAAWPVYVASLLGLGLVMTPLGYSAYNATRWISVGGINFQPSEAAKLAMVLVLAHYLAANEGRLRDLVGAVLPALGVAVPAILLVLLEPDFSTAAILAGLVGVMLYVAGLQWRWLLTLGGSGLVAFIGIAVLASYRMRRLSAFLDPYADPTDSGYQVVQGWIAMAHGGVLGQGLGAGVAQSGFLPEAHTDFIAAVVGEELGAVGWCALVLAQAVLVWRGTMIASRAPDLFGTLLASGVTMLLAVQTLVNLGVVTGLVPNTGLVLPFLSYGASAVVVHVVCIGLLLRVGLESPPNLGEG
ncbi:MAG: putative lipid II flippase FtsW [Deltaproteobacteria bacterium]|nr:putative lipid II flippase FtsW [Deltaproteobacteria bacterium]